MAAFPNDAERKIHRLVVQENNVEEIEVVLQSFFDLEVEEPDFEDSLRILDAVAHRQVADAVAEQHHVVAALKILEILGIL